jgi:hypothetical protein
MSENPFLLPPGGAKPADTPVTTPAPPRAIPDDGPEPDHDHYIAVPASVESATHRLARPAQEPVAPKPVAEEAAAPEPLSEDTMVAAPRRWALLLPDGVRVPLDGALLLGRDPAAIPERPDARLLAVTDPGKTVSKTHALLEPDPAGAGVRVTDLFSTNGVAVDTAQGRTLVAPGGLANAGPASSILLGSFVIEVAAVVADHA